MADRNVKVVVRADVADFLRGAGLVEGAARKMGEGAKKAGQEAKSGLSGMAQSVRDNRDAFNTVGGALTTYGIAVAGLATAVAKTGIEYNTLRQRSGAALTTLTGSAELANAQMDKLDAFASTSPFARDVFIKAQQQMFGFGIEAQKVIPYLDAIQNAVAASGGTNNDIAELSRIFSQISASAKITATDLREFGNRGIDAATIIGSQMGKTGAQIREDITAGTLDAQVALDALAAGMQDRFGGAADNVKNTMLGAVDRVKAAFRDLSSDLMTPFVDPEGGGMAVDLLNGIADGLRAIESAPTGLRNAVAGVGALSGVASLAAGAFLLLAPRAVDTYDALRKMGIIGPNTATQLGRIGQAAGGAAIGFAAIAGLSGVFSEIRRASEQATPGVEDFTSALLDVADSGSIDALDRKFADLGIQVNGLSGMAEGPLESFRGAVDRALNPSFIQRAEDMTDGLLGLRTSGDETAEALASLDSAVSGLVTSGNADAAAEAFDVMWMSMTGGAYSKEEFLTLFPQYAEALKGVENEARLAAEATEGFNESLLRVDPSIMQGKAEEIRGHNRDILRSFIDLGEDINNAELSLSGWMTKLEEQVAAAADFAENIAYLRGQGVNEAFIKGLMEQGPEGAMRAQQLADAIMGGETELVDRANEIGSAMGGNLLDGAQAALDGSDPVVMRAEAQADAAQVAAERERLTSVFLRDPAVMTVEADTSAAELQTAQTVLWAAEQTGIMSLDADALDAHIKIDQWNALAANTTGMPTLDADPQKAAAQLGAWLRDANRTVATSSLNADTSGASSATTSWKAWADRVSASASVGASTLPASNAVYGLLGWIGRQSATVSVYTRMAGGLNMGFSDRTRVSGEADGGIYMGGVKKYAGGGMHRQPGLAGPQYGRTNMILWGEPETRGEAFISNHPNYRAQNINYLRTAASWFGMDVVKAYAAGGVARQWTSPARQMSVSATAALAAEDRALLQAVASRPVSVSVDSREIARADMRGRHRLGAPATWSGGPRVGREAQ